MKQALIYSLKVWLTVVLVVPFIFYLTLFIRSNWSLAPINELINFVAIMIVFTALLSLCSGCLFLLFAAMLTKDEFNQRKVKMSLSVIGIFLAVVPVLLWNRFDLRRLVDDILIICYPFVTLLSIWFYRLEP